MGAIAFVQLQRLSGLAESRGGVGGLLGVGALLDGGPGPSETDLANGWLEVALVHVRTVTDFLDPKEKRRGDDVYASDYLPGWTAAAGGADLAALINQRPWINKRLAHITATRVRVGREAGARILVDLRAEYHGAIGAFLVRLSDEKRKWFTRQYQIGEGSGS